MMNNDDIIMTTPQVPTAVFLCGTSNVSAFGLAAARHLASHGVKTQVRREAAQML